MRSCPFLYPFVFSYKYSLLHSVPKPLHDTASSGHFPLFASDVTSLLLQTSLIQLHSYFHIKHEKYNCDDDGDNNSSNDYDNHSNDNDHIDDDDDDNNADNKIND